MWLIIAILYLFLPQTVLSQVPATDSATVIASPSAEVSPTITPIPVPTSNPVETLFKQYQSDYLFNRDQYQQAFLDYTNKKAVYTKYGTVSTLNDKIDATKRALITRNNTLKTYFRALRVKLDYYKNADSTNTSKLQIELTKLENWLDEQNTIISTLNNDNDIKNNAEKFKDKYLIVQQITYASLIQSEYNVRLLTLNQLRNYIPDLQNDSSVSADGKQWANSLVIKIDNAADNLTESLSIVARNSDSQNFGRFRNFYPDSKEKLSVATQYCIEVINDIRNILIKFSTTL